MAIQIPGFTFTLPANADLSANQFHAVVVNSSGNLAVGGNGVNCIGVLQDKPAAAGRAGTVMVNGVTKMMVGVGGTLDEGDVVACDANGEAEATSTGDTPLGTVIVGGAAGEICSVLLHPAGETN